jgi:hypothetical protein
LEGLFALADQLEVRLARARGQVYQLTPSLLAHAFKSPANSSPMRRRSESIGEISVNDDKDEISFFAN